ncbi:hypothetical protein [Streptomyces sp. YGL11-2]|uniref:hypothetical protein n=1 Tax=Streptomyces sp. YGL11-2 TaxID=3414028 RepID=UPI003CF82E0B
MSQLPDGASSEATSRVLVPAVVGTQHISWVPNDRTDIVDRVQKILTAVVP